MFDCWENEGKFYREPGILRTLTSVILDEVLASCFYKQCLFKLKFELEKINKNLTSFLFSSKFLLIDFNFEF